MNAHGTVLDTSIVGNESCVSVLLSLRRNATALLVAVTSLLSVDIAFELSAVAALLALSSSDLLLSDSFFAFDNCFCAAAKSASLTAMMIASSSRSFPSSNRRRGSTRR